MKTAAAFAVLVALAGCAAPVADPLVPQTRAFAEVDAQEVKIAELTDMIAALGPGVSRAEAARVARIAVEDPLKWAEAWQVEDPPLIHNIKVNNGTRPRGLCKDWADDLQLRMAREAFETLDWHRAIANHDNLRVEHSTLIVSARGATMQEGILLDPWRLGGGRLFYAAVGEDRKYRWLERQKVFALKRQWRLNRAQRNARTE